MIIFIPNWFTIIIVCRCRITTFTNYCHNYNNYNHQCNNIFFHFFSFQLNILSNFKSIMIYHLIIIYKKCAARSRAQKMLLHAATQTIEKPFQKRISIQKGAYIFICKKCILIPQKTGFSVLSLRSIVIIAHNCLFVKSHCKI